MNDIGQKCYDMYQQCLKNLEKDDPTLVDEIVVALWKTVEGLQAEKRVLQTLLDTQQQTLCEYYQKQDVLNSRIALLQGKCAEDKEKEQ